MRLLTMLTMIHGATTGRLTRLATRLANIADDPDGRREAVRYVWVNTIKDVVDDRVKYHVTDN
jgi:hypothetical protein